MAFHWETHSSSSQRQRTSPSQQVRALFCTGAVLGLPVASCYPRPYNSRYCCMASLLQDKYIRHPPQLCTPVSISNSNRRIAASYSISIRNRSLFQDSAPVARLSRAYCAAQQFVDGCLACGLLGPLRERHEAGSATCSEQHPTSRPEICSVPTTLRSWNHTFKNAS